VICSPTKEKLVKIKIKRESFQKVFQVAAAVAPARSPKTILQNVKLDVSNDEAVLTATDMEIGVRLIVPEVEVLAPGSAVIPVSRLNMILRESGDETLQIDANSDRILITGQNSRFELQGQNPDEFPEVAGFEETDYFELSAKVLRELIRRTLFATDAESSRYALGGVLLEMDDKTITAVGTDGRRLAKMQGTIKKVGNPKAAESATIVPARAMQVMERILPDSEVMVQLAARANDLLMKEENGIFYTRLVEGRFPKWREVLPNRQDSSKIAIPVGPMYSALRQAAIVASEDSRGVDFTFNNGTLVLSNNTAEVGQSRIEMPVSFDEDELTITLDHRFVADFLKVLQPDKTFTLDVENSDAAAYCETDDNYGYVIMPLSKDRR
jgi:DNA polymerase-3 subunit beta